MLIDFRKRGREEEREGKKHAYIPVRDKHRSVVPSMLPDWGLNPEPRHVP